MRDRLDLCPQLLLDLVKVEPILVRDQVNCQSEMPKSPGSANSMQISLTILWEVEINDDVNGLNVYASSEEIRADEISAHAVPEIVEHAITV